MVVRSRFDFAAYIGAWSDFRRLPDVASGLDELPTELRVGLATLVLLSWQRPYWVGLGLLASYADEHERSLPDLLEVLAPGGELPWSAAEEVSAWAATQTYAAEVGDQGQATAGVYTVGTSLRPEALAMAADAASRVSICIALYKPDWPRVRACIRGQAGG
jgi:hypothetical protein